MPIIKNGHCNYQLGYLPQRPGTFYVGNIDPIVPFLGMSVGDVGSRAAGKPTCCVVHASVSNTWITTVFSLVSERPPGLFFRLVAASDTFTWFTVFLGMLRAL